ncbi:MAG: hypothetical protein SFW36_23070 [Leptolyngbyaceae cyanobacterium bins.59]|nr:hypothetical protein [Leptolyngbyaceae cyanobacterium bins.59]
MLPSSSPDWDEEITSGLLSQDIDPTDTDVFSLEDLEWVNNVSE